jgi:hypothetical protein
MQKIKTANVILIIAIVVIAVGFVLVLTRKQSVTVSGETTQLKNYWGKGKSADATPTAAA